MIASGARDAIVSVASEAGKKGHIESLACSASKAALINMTRMLSATLAPHDINVNCAQRQQIKASQKIALIGPPRRTRAYRRERRDH
jgi:NAD(P)-dependent dehydrogenase (short-subunit alcohol dehydrogenase family)